MPVERNQGGLPSNASTSEVLADGLDPDQPKLDLARNARLGILAEEAETAKRESLQQLTQTLQAVLLDRLIDAPTEEFDIVMGTQRKTDPSPSPDGTKRNKGLNAEELKAKREQKRSSSSGREEMTTPIREARLRLSGRPSAGERKT